MEHFFFILVLSVILLFILLQYLCQQMPYHYVEMSQRGSSNHVSAKDTTLSTTTLASLSSTFKPDLVSSHHNFEHTLSPLNTSLASYVNVYIAYAQSESSPLYRGYSGRKVLAC